MKKSLLCLVGTLVALGVAFSAQARTHEETKQIIKNPITIARTASPHMQVIFPHKAHRGESCLVCHHQVTDDHKVYTSCDTLGCHTGKDVADRSKTSYFMVIHDPTASHSCLACHTKKAAEKPGLDNCTTCHQAPLRAEN